MIVREAEIVDCSSDFHLSFSLKIMPRLCQVISHFPLFLSCWPFILHSPASQTTSFFIPTSPFVDTSGYCLLFFPSNKLIRIPYSKPTTWSIEQKSAFALHCLFETALEMTLQMSSYIPIALSCLANSVENGKELSVWGQSAASLPADVMSLLPSCFMGGTSFSF